MISLTSDIRTPWHGVAAGPKLLALCLWTLALSYAVTVPTALEACVVVVMLYAVGGWAFMRQGLRLLKPLWFFAAIVGGWHVVTGEITQGLVIILRLGAAIGAANLVTLTTRLDKMLAVIERCLAVLRVPLLARRRLALAVGLVIRFTPVLAQKGTALATAWRARSPRRPGWRLMVPFALTALDDADRVADAIKARGGA